MNFKPWLALLILATMALAMAAEASKVHDFGYYGVVGDVIGEDNEMLLDSEASRRTLRGRRGYISYGALKAGQVPCGRRGRSYYNCQQRGRANPYRRGCTAATHCARNLNN
ncbi:protein RALF-like 19 [Lotus japonicus]|uniref:protein RALF-like 19 n=1 Tax=Lotus japonicus TaxID=34305 RepID=UPI0025840D4E|nr:protein RALF-like 19 [Lotus japonicus]